MTKPIAEPASLPGTEVTEQSGMRLGKVTRLYAPGGRGEPMWVAIELRTGLAGRDLVIVPLARLKDEDGTIVVPYSAAHVREAPDVEVDSEISVEDDHRLRDYYGIGRGDEPVREKNPDLYSTRVRDGDAPSKEIEGTARAGGAEEG